MVGGSFFKVGIYNSNFISIKTRGVPGQHFQNPAGTGFIGSFHRIRPDFTG